MPWTQPESDALLQLVMQYGQGDWADKKARLNALGFALTRTPKSLESQYYKLCARKASGSATRHMRSPYELAIDPDSLSNIDPNALPPPLPITALVQAGGGAERVHLACLLASRTADTAEGPPVLRRTAPPVVVSTHFSPPSQSAPQLLRKTAIQPPNEERPDAYNIDVAVDGPNKALVSATKTEIPAPPKPITRRPKERTFPTPTSWSPADTKLLREAVLREGPGNWKSKAAKHFKGLRTAKSLEAQYAHARLALPAVWQSNYRCA